MIGIPLTIVLLVAIVWVIVVLVRPRDKEIATSEAAGVPVRRFFVYVVMIGTGLLVAIGLAGLVDAAAAAATSVTTDSTAVARSIAFVVVGLPVYFGLARYTARRLREDPREQRSLGWALYLTVALVGSLITAMSLTTAFLGELLEQGRVDRELLAMSLIWAGIWAGHWWVAKRKGDPKRMQPHLILGSAAGLISVAIGAGAQLYAVLEQIYDSVFDVRVIDSDGVESLVRPLVILIVGGAVWFWYWFRQTLSANRTPLWLIYVLLLGVLGGVAALIGGAGSALFGVLQWFFRDLSTDAAAHFAFMPGAVAAMAVGAASWAYHGVLLGGRQERERTEIDRVYDYVLSGAGLVVAASGIAALLTVAIDAVGADTIAASDAGDASAMAVTLLLIGAPLWWRYWSTIRSYRRDEPETELRSVTRRVYLFLLFGAAAIAAVISLIVVVFIVFEDMLEGVAGSSTISSAAVPVAILVTAGALAWYHFVVFREDRAAVPEETRIAVRNVILVAAQDEQLATLIREGTGAKVRALQTAGGSAHAVSADGAVEALRGGTHGRVVVVAGDNGFDLIPIKD